ncbi:MAG: hypothetical protein ACNA78_02640 [Balneolaceae bacterium]
MSHKSKDNSSALRKQAQQGASFHREEGAFESRWSHHSVWIPLVAGILQIKTGLLVVAVSILGLLQPLWLAALLSLIGSISSMIGVYLVYHAFSRYDTFDTVLNQAIRRAIYDKN